MLSVLKLCVHALLATKRCLFWTTSMRRVVPTLLALILKLQAEVNEPTGAVMHAPLVLAAFVVTQSVNEIAADALNPAVLLLASIRLNAAVELMATLALSAAMLVDAAEVRIGKCEQLVFE